MHCPHCGFEVAADFLFCPKCGNTLSRNCPKCSYVCSPEFLYCPKCGTEITLVVSPPAVDPSQPATQTNSEIS